MQYLRTPGVTGYPKKYNTICKIKLDALPGYVLYEEHMAMVKNIPQDLRQCEYTDLCKNSLLLLYHPLFCVRIALVTAILPSVRVKIALVTPILPAVPCKDCFSYSYIGRCACKDSFSYSYIARCACKDCFSYSYIARCACKDCFSYSYIGRCAV